MFNNEILRISPNLNLLHNAPLYMAMQNMLTCRGVEADNCTLSEVLKKHRNEHLYADKSQTYRITVRRSDIWKDSIQCFKRSFDTCKHLRITFLGEPAVDDGGPRREFFMLFMARGVARNFEEGFPARKFFR